MEPVWLDSDSSDESPPVPPVGKKKRSIAVWLVCLFIGGGISMLVCCGGLFHFGMGLVADGVWEKVESDPRFTAHVGQVKKHQMAYGASFAADKDVLVYDVEGTKWSGRVSVKYEDDDAGDEQILWVRFTLSTGEIVELKPEGADDAP